MCNNYTVCEERSKHFRAILQPSRECGRNGNTTQIDTSSIKHHTQVKLNQNRPMITEVACHSTRALAELCRRKIMAKRYARHSSVEVVRHQNVVNSTVFLPAVIDTVVINIVPVLAESKPKVQK
jgi:hypothetical protein